jgi:hypothetical protein
MLIMRRQWDWSWRKWDWPKHCFKSVKILQATNNNEILVWDFTLQGVSPFSIFFVEQNEL